MSRCWDFLIDPAEDEEIIPSYVMEQYNFMKVLQLYNRPIEDTFEDDHIAACSTTCPVCDEKIKFMFTKNTYSYSIEHANSESNCRIRSYRAFCHALFVKLCETTGAKDAKPIEVFCPDRSPACVDGMMLSEIPVQFRAKALSSLQSRSSILQWRSAEKTALTIHGNPFATSITKPNTWQFPKTDFYYGYILKAYISSHNECLYLSVAIGYGVVVTIKCPMPSTNPHRPDSVVTTEVMTRFGQASPIDDTPPKDITKALLFRPVKMFAVNEYDIGDGFVCAEIPMFRFVGTSELDMLNYVAKEYDKSLLPTRIPEPKKY